MRNSHQNFTEACIGHLPEFDIISQSITGDTIATSEVSSAVHIILRTLWWIDTAPEQGHSATSKEKSNSLDICGYVKDVERRIADLLAAFTGQLAPTQEQPKPVQTLTKIRHACGEICSSASSLTLLHSGSINIELLSNVSRCGVSLLDESNGLALLYGYHGLLQAGLDTTEMHPLASILNVLSCRIFIGGKAPTDNISTHLRRFLGLTISRDKHESGLTHKTQRNSSTRLHLTLSRIMAVPHTEDIFEPQAWQDAVGTSRDLGLVGIFKDLTELVCSESDSDESPAWLDYGSIFHSSLQIARTLADTGVRRQPVTIEEQSTITTPYEIMESANYFVLSMIEDLERSAMSIDLLPTPAKVLRFIDAVEHQLEEGYTFFF